MLGLPIRQTCSMLLGVLCLVLLAPGALAFDEGIDYRRISKQPGPVTPGGGIEVLEFFWYGCPHCDRLEPALRRWVAEQSEAVRVISVPAAHSPRWEPHARLFYTAQQLGVLDRLHNALFDALHRERRVLASDAALLNFAIEQGVDADALRQTMHTFPVDLRLREAADWAMRFGIDSVPMFVVNGRFVTSPTMAGSQERVFEVLDDLIARELARLEDSRAQAELADHSVNHSVDQEDQ